MGEIAGICFHNGPFQTGHRLMAGTVGAWVIAGGLGARMVSTVAVLFGNSGG